MSDLQALLHFMLVGMFLYIMIRYTEDDYGKGKL